MIVKVHPIKTSIKLKYYNNTMMHYLFSCLVWMIFFVSVSFGGQEFPNTIRTIDINELDQILFQKDAPYMIAVMASWCGPCREELPVLSKLYSKYEAKGLKMVGISLDVGGPHLMQPIIEKLKVNFPIYWIGEKGMDHYHITAIPIIFVIKNGQIVEKIIGKRSEKYLEEKITRLLE